MKIRLSRTASLFAKIGIVGVTSFLLPWPSFAQTPQTLLGSNGFENAGSPSYSVGTILGQDGWLVVKGTSADATIQNSVYFSTEATDTSGPPAGQALKLSGVGGYVAAERTVSVTQNAYYDVWVYTPPSTSNIGSGGLLPLVLRSSANKIFLQVSLNKSGNVTVSYLNSSSDTPLTNLNLASSTYNWTTSTWTQVTLFVDAANKKFTVYLNGMSDDSGTDVPFQYGSGTPGRTANEAVYWYSATGDTTPVYVDNFHITAAQVPMPATYLGSAMTTPAGSSQSNVLLGQVKDSSLTPSALLGTRAMVYAGQTTSLPYCFTGRYYPSMRDYSQTHTFSWFRANHPDWLAYKTNTDPSDVTTTAHTYVYCWGEYFPIDITNPAVRQYILYSWLVPQINAGFPAITFDNVGVDNGGDWHYVYNNGAWVSMGFTGTQGDPAFEQAMIDYLTWIRNELHFLGVSFIANLHPNTNATSQTPTLLDLTATMTAIPDIWLLEDGFGDADKVSPVLHQSLELAGTGNYVTAQKAVSVTTDATYGVEVCTPPATADIGTGGLRPLILSGSTGHVFAQVALNSSGNVTVIYCNSNTADTTATLQLTSSTYQWLTNAWTLVQIAVDTANKTFTVLINGKSDSTGSNLPFGYGTGTAGTTATEAVSWCSAAGNATALYCDNFVITAGCTTKYTCHGFEASAEQGGKAPYFTAGSISGQDGWTVSQGSTASATIQNGVYYPMNSPFIADSHWINLFNFVAPQVQNGSAFMDLVYMNTSLTTVNADFEWVLANYLLIRGSQTYLAMQGPLDAPPNFPTYPAQYNPAVGAPSGVTYTSGGLYIRDYATGEVIVNPSSTAAGTYTVPSTHVWKDLLGNAVAAGARSIPAHTALVLIAQ